MDNRYRDWLLLLIGLLASTIVAQARAQQPQQPGVPEPQSPAVLAVLETNPSTPAEQVRAAKILADLGRPDLGKQFLQRVIAAKLDPQELAALGERFGSATFVNMAGREELLPEAKQLADAILAAANRQLQDPKRIAGLIRQLGDPSADVRWRAVRGLKEARWAAVGPMVEVLADPARADEHANVRAALVRIRAEAIKPLIGILERSDPKLMAQAIQVLAQMDAKQSAIYLLGPYTSQTSDPAVRAAAGAALKRLLGHVPGKRQAIRLLSDRAKDYFEGGRTIKADADGRVELWSWDVGRKQCVSKKYSVEDATLMIAARLARDAYALAKHDPEIRLLYLTTMLEAAAYEAGLDKPLQEGKAAAVEEAAGFGVEVVEDVLEYAVAGDHVAAATAAARILGQKGAADALLRQGNKPAPLVRAARHPDRRLRLAAAEAIVRLQPSGPYPGSSHVPQALAFFAGSGGVRRALAAGPSTETSRQLAGLLAGLGFEVDTAVTGREVIRLAVTSPDYEVAMIDAAIEQPTADLLLQQLRRDCRTATLRVGLVARSGYLERAGRIARRDRLTLAFSRPHGEEAIRWQMERLDGLAPREFVPHGERGRQAGVALDCLAELGRSSPGLYDVRRVQDSLLAALYTPGLTAKAVAVLEDLGTPASQRALVDLASRWTQPLEVRKGAVRAFGRSVEEHGILLTTDEILRQYDRYNQSEDLDPATQRVLGLILDWIEAPTEPVKVKQEGAKAKAEGEG